jgi:hypothetical protein
VLGARNFGAKAEGEGTLTAVRLASRSLTTALAVGGCLGLSTLVASADVQTKQQRPPVSVEPLTIAVARGDGDANDVADRLEPNLPRASLGRMVTLAAGDFSEETAAPSAGPLRLVAEDGRWLGASGKKLREEVPPLARVFVVGTAPGRAALRTTAGLREVSVVDVRVFDAEGQEIDVAHSWAALTRMVPAELGGEEEGAGQGRPLDAEAITFVLVGPPGALPEQVDLISLSPTGQYRDSLQRLGLVAAPCPADVVGSELGCKRSKPVRVVGDAVDRAHPSVIDRSIVGEVGGRLALRLNDKAELSLPIGAPRNLEPGGPGRYRARLRARIVRTTVHGAPAIGTSDAEARDLVLAEIAMSSQIWGQCGIHFGDPGDVDVKVVDPPEPSYVSVGCDAGLPASGGTISLSVQGSTLELKTAPGQTPEAVAGRLAELLSSRGYQVDRFKNPRNSGSALPTIDVGVRDRRGRRVPLRAARGGEMSSDPSLRVCALDVSLDDGLDHFGDGDSASGTLEERALLRALLDEDPRTIDLVIVPIFSGSGRIGESFIWSPGASIQNALILDRGGVRASTRSFTLSHELGHIFLDMPGHPDDYGVDIPTSLMDADAADGTIFGPRRLSLLDCRRALSQSGLLSPVPLLEPWPLKVQSGKR